MGRLKLRNCTKFDLRYWRALGKKHFVRPGTEAYYDWGATYTLDVSKANGHGHNKRDAVNRSGTYYAYWTDGKVDILSEDQARGRSYNEDNPFITTWFKREPKELGPFPVTWTMTKSRDNTNGVSDIDYEVTEEKGFKMTTSQTHTLKVTDSTGTKLEVGTEFEVKGVKVAAKVENESTHEVEEVTETMTETEVYTTTTEKISYTITKGDSLAIWQPVANVLGHKLFLNSISCEKIGDPAPTLPAFGDIHVSVMAGPP